MAQSTHTNNITSDAKTGFDKVATYNGPTKHIGDFTANDHINKQAAEEIASASSGVLPDLSFKIPIGTPLPFLFYMSDYIAYGLVPWVEKAIEDVGSDGTRLRNVSDIEHDYNYEDNTKTVLSHIEINGHDDGDGNFAEDTYVVIKQNSPATEIIPLGIDFYKVKNETPFDLKYWNNDPITNPDGDPSLAVVTTMPPNDIAVSFLGPIGGMDAADHAYFSGADDRTIDIWYNGVLTESAVSIHDLVVFLTQAGPAIGGNYWIIKEHI